MANDELPEGWIDLEFDELNSFKSKTIDPSDYPDEVFELYSVPTFPTRKPELLAGRAIGSTKQVVEPGDVLICKINPRINRVWKVMPKTDKRQIASSEWIVMRANGMNSEFLRTYFCSQAFREILCVDLTGVGGSLTRAQPKRVAKFRVPLAPVAEQKRIADKLEAVLRRVDACRARLDRVPGLLKHFRQSVLAAATSGQLTEDWRKTHAVSSVQESIDTLGASAKTRRGVSDSVGAVPEPLALWECPSTWAKATAGQLISKGIFIDVKDGNHGSNHPKVSEFTSDGLPFITAAQVRDFRIDYDDAYKIKGEPLSKLRVGFAKADDVILTHKGTVGRVAVADRDCILTPQTTYYRVNPEWLEPKYLMYFLASPAFGNQLDEIKSQTTRDFVPISQQYSLGHLIPTRSEQAEIVRRVEALFALADRIEARLATAQRLVERLTPATLSKAFRGDLVPQDPNDEPAPKLLERLGQSSASSVKKPSKGLKAR